MRSLTTYPLFVMSFVMVGCKDSKSTSPDAPAPGKLESIPDSAPPAKGPMVPNDAALRPHYQMAAETVPMGTGFVIKDKSGKLYMLTAAHIMDDDAEWAQVKAVSLHVMGGNPTAKVQGKPRYIGKSFQEINDTSNDLVIWPLADGAKVSPLKLAAADPKKNEWVWMLGQEPGTDTPQKMFRCKVTGTQAGGLLLQQHDRFQMMGFSGGPLVNAQGEVVGTLLGGGAPTVLAMSVGSIRKRLADAKIELP